MARFVKVDDEAEQKLLFDAGLLREIHRKEGDPLTLKYVFNHCNNDYESLQDWKEAIRRNGNQWDLGVIVED